jgi:hypothetical protein
MLTAFDTKGKIRDMVDQIERKKAIINQHNNFIHKLYENIQRKKLKQLIFIIHKQFIYKNIINLVPISEIKYH